MSDAMESSKAEEVDLTKEKPQKKLKQMRLPFAVIPKKQEVEVTKDDPTKVSAKAENEKKRKNSTDADKITPNKKEKVDTNADAEKKSDSTKEKTTEISQKAPAQQDENSVKVKDNAKPGRRISLTTLSSSVEKKKRVPLIPAGSPQKKAKTDQPSPKAKKRVDLTPVSKDKKPEEAKVNTEETPLPSTPTTSIKDKLALSTPSSSPSVLAFRKRKISVDKAKLTVSINEFNEEMEIAAEKKEFLMAAEIKTKLDELTKQKQLLEDALNSAEKDPEKFDAFWKTLEEAKNGGTPKTATPKTTTPKSCKRSASKVATPGTTPTSKTSPSTSKSPTSTPKARKMTPAQEAKKKEAAEKREKERLEREKKKQEEQEKKEEKKRKLEEERKKKLEEKELEKKKKENERLMKEKLRELEKQKKELQKQREKEEKEKERRMKEEAKLAEVEKKQKEKEAKEEEKRKKEEAEKAKIEKAAKSFSSFFIKKKHEEGDNDKEDEVVTGELPGGLVADSIPKAHVYQFRVKKDMKLAPIVRRVLGEDEKGELDSVLSKNFNLEGQDQPKKSLKALKNKSLVRKCPRTWPPEEKKDSNDDEIEIIEDEEEEDEDIALPDNEISTVMEDETIGPKRVKAKLLQFTENERPPYWGTWSKKSKFVSGRRPFGQDSELFNYDYDSDEDWEEEEQGESLSDEEKDKEDDEEDVMDDDDDDGFFVGHGVLDKDEIMNLEDSDDEAESGKASDQEPGKGLNPNIDFDENLEMTKQKLRAQAFEEEYNRKKKVGKLKPKVFGCLWVHDDRESVAYEQLLKILKPARCITLRTGPIPTAFSQPKNNNEKSEDTKDGAPGSTPGHGNGSKDTPSAAKKIRTFPEEAYPDLIRLVHANLNNKQFLSKEFSAFWAKKTCKDSTPSTVPNAEGKTEQATPTSASVGADLIPRTKILEALNEIANYTKFPDPGPMQGRTCWVVKPEFLAKYDLTGQLAVPNDWKYIMENQPNRPSIGTSTPSAEGDGAANKAQGQSQAKVEPEKPKNTIKAAFTNAAAITPKRKPKADATESPKVKSVEKVKDVSKSESPKPKPNPIKAAFSMIPVKRKPKAGQGKEVEVVDLVTDELKPTKAAGTPVKDSASADDNEVAKSE